MPVVIEDINFQVTVNPQPHFNGQELPEDVTLCYEETVCSTVYVCSLPSVTSALRCSDARSGYRGKIRFVLFRILLSRTWEGEMEPGPVKNLGPSTLLRKLQKYMNIMNEYLKKTEFPSIEYRWKAKHKKSGIQLNGIPTFILLIIVKIQWDCNRAPPQARGCFGVLDVWAATVNYCRSCRNTQTLNHMQIPCTQTKCNDAIQPVCLLMLRRIMRMKY
jgi:hypothetical protein